MNEELASISEQYIPSTVEKKRAITALFFVGIVMMLSVQKELSVFERYYLAFSLSLWSLGLIMFLLAVLIFFVASIVGYLFVLVLLAWFGIWAFAVQQARAGAYNHSFVVVKLLVGLGDWILSLFSDETPPVSEPSVWV